MMELFPNISEFMRQYARIVWDRVNKADPNTASRFLDSITNTFEKNGLEEETEFLRFYFNMKLEELKNEMLNNQR